MAAVDIIGMRDRILEKATDLFVTQGYSAISMREIAEACGISKAGLYYYFKDKEDLLLSILGDNLNTLEQLINEVEAQGQTPLEQIRLFIQIIFTRLPAGRRSIIRLASQEMDKISPEARVDFHHRYEAQFINRIRHILEAGIRAGELRAMDAGLCTWSLLGLMYPFMNQENAGHIDQTVAFISGVFLDGVRERPTSLPGL